MNEIRNYSTELVKAKNLIHETCRFREQGIEALKMWRDACERFYTLFAQAHNERSFYPDEEKLKDCDSASIDCAINYLIADPYYHRSGYNKQRLIRNLKRVPLTKANQLNLMHVILKVVDTCDRREFRSYCKLAKSLKLVSLISRDKAVRRRASWMLEYCDE